MTSPSDRWLRQVEDEMRKFAAAHSFAYVASPRELSAAFEIGCFHSLLRLYAEECTMTLGNLQDGKYRYLTTPNGNPANFSFVKLHHSGTGDDFEVRQQVRVRSVVDPSIAFTPDLLVMPSDTDIQAETDDAYAHGKRRFFVVDSDTVIAAHECKSMNPFPELLVSFLGMLITAHNWLTHPRCRDMICPEGIHLAPTLFVGGTPSLWHSRMVGALASAYPINVVTGMHGGTWNLRHTALNMFILPAQIGASARGAPSTTNHSDL